jgi:predicted transcriptional regulator
MSMNGGQMKKLTIRIRKDTKVALKEMGERFIKTWKTGKSAGDTIEFESPAAMFRLLTPKRWELLERLQIIGPSSVRGLARELERDVKRVHEDVSALIYCGIVARTDDGKVEVPFKVIHADFDLCAVA